MQRIHVDTISQCEFFIWYFQAFKLKAQNKNNKKMRHLPQKLCVKWAVK